MFIVRKEVTYAGMGPDHDEWIPNDSEAFSATFRAYLGLRGFGTWGLHGLTGLQVLGFIEVLSPGLLVLSGFSEFMYRVYGFKDSRLRGLGCERLCMQTSEFGVLEVWGLGLRDDMWVICLMSV